MPVLLLRFFGPRSYTGEDAAEVQVPGNPALIERVLALLLAEPGLRLAGPGEFSARAYLNGRLGLDEAEGVAATISAQTDEQLAAARRLTTGETGRRYGVWADELTTLLALVEAGIDFSDQEDVTPIAPAKLAERLIALHEQIRAMLGPAAATESRDDRPSVVLAGRPNAGKSTLFNALLGRRRAVTSDEPGTTRDVLVEVLDLGDVVPGGGGVRLVDLPGIESSRIMRGEGDGRGRGRGGEGGEEGGGTGCPPGQPVAPGTPPMAPTPADRAAMTQAERAIHDADGVIHCDPTGRFPAIPSATGKPTLRVRTKADLPMGDGGDLAVCALDGWHVDVLQRAIADMAMGRNHGGELAVLPRHRRALVEVAERLTEAGVIASGREVPAELLAEALRGSLDRIGELVGRIDPDDVLGRVFATFCVGK